MRKMTPQQLKNSILQMAMQGKLVAQRPEEGTGEELYQQIQVEKKRLIKEGKIKKSKKLPEITEDEIPFEIPENWKWVRLGYLGQVTGGGTPKTGNPEYWDDNGIPWLTPADMKFVTGKYVKHGKRNISELGLAKSSAQLMPRGSVLYSSRAPIGYIAIALNDICTNQGFKSIVPAITELNDYLYYCLIAATPNIIARASGTTFKEISGTGFGETVIPLPPLEEQKRIVAKLEEIQPLLDRYEKAYNRLETYNQKFPENLKKSILQYAGEGKLVEQRPEEGTGEELYQQIQAEKKKLIKEGKIKKSKKLPEITEDEIPFEIPKNWKWAKFGEIVDFFIGKTPKRHESQYWQKSEFPWVSISDLIDRGHIQRTKENISSQAAEKVFKNRFAPKGTLLMSFKLTIGKVSILDIDAFHNEAIISIFPIIERDNIFRDYLFDFLPLISAEGKTKSAIKGKTLNSNSLKNLLVPIPPLEEQKRIVAKVEELMPLVEKCGEDRKD
jgi:type I restriction enzyme S subunit